MKRLICALRLTGAIIIFLSLSQSSQAQYGMLQGWVRDKKGNLLAGASVTIKGKQIGTATDQRGCFKLKLSPGNYVLIITFIDHSVLQERIAISKGIKLKKKFTTGEVYKQCPEVVVLCPRPKERPGNDMNTMPASDTAQSKMARDSFGTKYRSPFAGSINSSYSELNITRPDPYLNVSRQLFFRMYRKWSLAPGAAVKPWIIHVLYDFSIYGINRKRNY